LELNLMAYSKRLVNAWNYFKSTQYAKEIENATKAKRDQMGWE